MANKKYTELPQADAITGAEILAMVQDGGSVQGNIDLIKAYFDTLYAPVSSIMTTPTSVTPTFTGFGSVSGISAYTWRVGAQLFFEITFTSGTATGTEARIGLRYNPGSGEVDVTTASTYPTTQLIGNVTYNSTTATSDPVCVLAEASKTYVTIGLQQTGTYAGLIPNTGSALAVSGWRLALKGSVRIQGW